MPIEHLALPYSRAALEPHLSAATLEAHHGVCYRSEVDRLNARIEGSEFAELTLEDIIAQAQGTLFHLAAQVWNHTFYWQCLRPRGGGEPLGRLADRIAKSFGDFVHFRQEFNRVALGTFGSGWVWLVQRPDGTLAIVATPNASTPLTGPDTPLLACDLWEHAYYLDYRQDRAQYLDAFWKLINWDFVASRLG
ncbi:iron superoxide dismutase [Xanthomonas arboricola pv. juglandis]|jgi:Fe-Mn family superoxide dismutase|uniref:superoxide dismutase n=1 Tax=Xanthomonas TaxID=338 RepID=UPI000CEE3478|nr:MULTISPECIES: Fe-Mn family superoxide dismutase [Xanthomonas]PPT33271.1 superoxide dismutase [Xanthomonas arboricola]SYZ52547.1 iron superoxide dismutase [Xanthomonas arboricola pv. juglandis]MBB5768024.1 Fe-Mn family superoxide dismutase [Xanthomonas euroxanthea]NIJ91981.1 Fe-Mn family superoxide dismutase [Xanthomonas euroxanthea]NIK38322.1 Fe-Mn family superoxide dismutase [Xanthomonas euroxanthea]